MTRVHWLALSAMLAGCGGSGESRAAGAETAAADSATLAATAPSPERRVTGVMIGRRVGAGNRVIEPTFEFAPSDTVHLSVATEGSTGAGSLTAAWRSQTGIVQQSSLPVGDTGDNTAFAFSQPKGLNPGTYKVVLFLGEDSVDTKVFVVKK
jgi:hypothetical protein